MKLLTTQQRLEILRSLETNATTAFMIAADMIEKNIDTLIQDKKNEFEALISGMNKEIEQKQLKDGKTPKKFVDYFTPAEIKEMIDLSSPKKGKDYFTEADTESFVKIISSRLNDMVEVSVNDNMPVAGEDYPTITQIEDRVMEMYTSLLNSGDIENSIEQKGEGVIEGIKKDFPNVSFGQQIINAINSLPYDPRYLIPAARISGLSKKGGKYMHGGGDTVVAGIGISISTDSSGLKTISASGGGFTSLTSTETVDGILTTYTFPSALAKPSFMIIDGAIQRATASDGAVYWTWNNATKKATFTLPPQDDIIGIV